LIGIATWGSLANRDELEVKPKSFNYGYNTRDPVKYDDIEAAQRSVLLEQNHSHFLLVLVTLPTCMYGFI
jgi:hypothetical protein